MKSIIFRLLYHIYVFFIYPPWNGSVTVFPSKLNRKVSRSVIFVMSKENIILAVNFLIVVLPLINSIVFYTFALLYNLSAEIDDSRAYI